MQYILAVVTKLPILFTYFTVHARAMLYNVCTCNWLLEFTDKRLMSDVFRCLQTLQKKSYLCNIVILVPASLKVHPVRGHLQYTILYSDLITDLSTSPFSPSVCQTINSLWC